jgi:phage-related protein
MKPIEFLGDSLERIREFPSGPKREAGHQLDRIQRGLEPDDWKPISTVGSGVKELRIRDDAGTYRVIYLAKLEQAVYVLHGFQKKTRKTSTSDIALATERYRQLMRKAK